MHLPPDDVLAIILSFLEEWEIFSLRCVCKDFHVATSKIGFLLKVGQLGRQSMLDELKHLDTDITRLQLKKLTNIPNDILTWNGFSRVHTLIINGHVSFYNSQLACEESLPQCANITSLKLIRHRLTSDTISWLQTHARTLKKLEIVEPLDSYTTTLSTLSRLDFDLEEYKVYGGFKERSYSKSSSDHPSSQTIFDIPTVPEFMFPKNMHNLRALNIDLKGRDQSKLIMSSICTSHLTDLELFIQGDCYHIIEDVISSYPLVFDKLTRCAIRVEFGVSVEFHVSQLCQSMNNIKDLTFDFNVSRSSLSKIADLNLIKLDVRVAKLDIVDTFFAKRHERLIDLTIRGTDFTADHYDFQRALANFNRLERLKFTRCCFDRNNNGDELAINLATSVDNSPQMKELILEECNIKKPRRFDTKKKLKIIQKKATNHQERNSRQPYCNPCSCFFFCFFLCISCCEEE